MKQLQLNTNGFEKTEVRWPFLFFGQTCTNLNRSTEPSHVFYNVLAWRSGRFNAS
jgi:hypothetical protein